MANRRHALVILAFAALVATTLACNMPTPSSAPQPPPPTVTPYVPVPAPPPSQATLPPPPPPPPPVTTPEATPAEATPAEVTPAEATPVPETPAPTAPPPTNPPPPPQPTPTPTQPVSAGPLDFEKPEWVHSWEPLNGSVKVVVKIVIYGGAAPFTVSHGPNVVGETMERTYLIEFERAGCSGIAQSITVASADGQSVKKDYWIGTDRQPWCTP